MLCHDCCGELDIDQTFVIVHALRPYVFYWNADIVFEYFPGIHCMHIIDQDDLGELPDVYAAAECRFLYAAEDGAEFVRIGVLAVNSEDDALCVLQKPFQGGLRRIGYVCYVAVVLEGGLIDDVEQG